ncbi:MAG: hypothetical protein ACLSF1_07760 [Bacteroides thetaiotaomicron]
MRKRHASQYANFGSLLVSDYLTSIIRSGNACKLLLYYTYYRSFFVYIINVIEFSSGFYLQIYNIKSGLSSPPCFFRTSDYPFIQFSSFPYSFELNDSRFYLPFSSFPKEENGDGTDFLVTPNGDTTV